MMFTALSAELVFKLLNSYKSRHPKSLIFSSNFRFDWYLIEGYDAICVVTNNLSSTDLELCSELDYDRAMNDLDHFRAGILFLGLSCPVLMTKPSEAKAFNPNLNYPKTPLDVNFHRGVFLTDGIGTTWESVVKDHEQMTEVIEALYQ